MKVIDARGKNCPIPVIMTKKAITEGETALTVLVDNKIATQNLEKLAGNSAMSFSCTEKGSDFEVVLLAQGAVINEEKPKSNDSDWAVFVTEKSIGTTQNELGESLMKMYFYTLAQGTALPSVCIFMNEGVRLLENEEIRQSFSELAIKGVRLMFCGACLNFYKIANLCAKENISNMYAIIEEMDKYGKVVKL